MGSIDGALEGPPHKRRLSVMRGGGVMCYLRVTCPQVHGAQAMAMESRRVAPEVVGVQRGNMPRR